MATGPNSLQMLKLSAPIPRDPVREKRVRHICKHAKTHMYTHNPQSHVPHSHLHLGFSASFGWIWGSRNSIPAQPYSQRAPSRAGQVAWSTSSGFGPWKAPSFVPSGVWALRRALYPRSPWRRRSTWAGRWILHHGKDWRGLACLGMQLPSAGTACCQLLPTTLAPPALGAQVGFMY